MKNKPILAAVLLSAFALLSACNTVEGAGKDVSSAGQAVSGAASDAAH
ncbi:MAG TPA: entericidin A/B family lipoprotein [Sphingobium sp.]